MRFQNNGEVLKLETILFASTCLRIRISKLYNALLVKDNFT